MKVNIDKIRRTDYPKILEKLQSVEPETKTGVLRYLCKYDLFFLLRYICKREDIENDWLFARCREVQTNPDGMLDLWAREHYKSTLITFGLTIQEILKDPEITIGIFSHTRPIAKGFLVQIKREFEINTTLKGLFQDILHENPRKEAQRWSEDGGLVVKRKTNPNAGTVEAWGLVDGQPTSKHYRLLVYDDVVTLSSVGTPEQIEKTTDAMALSFNLGAHGGARRFIGTRYHFADTYHEIINRQIAEPRIHAATDDGTMGGTPVFLTRESLAEKRQSMGAFVFAAQMLLDPLAAGKQSFKREWLKYWTADNLAGLNLYLLCDPANSKKKNSDYTVFMVVGLGPDSNYYIVDIVRDKLNLGERAETLFSLHRKYKPIKTGYERYGKDADIQHFEALMRQKNYRFDIVELGGKIAKEDRIARLIPDFEQGKVYLPVNRMYKDYEGKDRELVNAFIVEEFNIWPMCAHDDMLDAMARIYDIEPSFPIEEFNGHIEPELLEAY